jgi:hypothetical protein
MGSWVRWALEEYDPGAAFPGVIGQTIDESGPAWPAGRRRPRRLPGSGRGGYAAMAGGVREILVWTKAPFSFRNELVVADAVVGAARAAKPGEVRRLGKHAAIVVLAVGGGARIEVASADGCERDCAPSVVGGPVR